MKLTFFFLFIFSVSFGQRSIYDTIYHPFNYGVQIIELKPTKNKHIVTGFTTSEESQFPHLQKFLVRNEAGEAIQEYNDFNNTLNSDMLRNVDYQPKRIAYHKLKINVRPQHTGVSRAGYNVMYPVYRCNQTDNAPCSKKKVGLMDSLGNILFPIEYTKIEWIDSVFIMEKNGMSSMYNNQLELIIENYEQINFIYPYYSHLAVKKNGKFGLIDPSGKVLMPFEYDELRKSKYMHGYYEFQQGDKWGFINYQLSETLPAFSPSPNLFRRDGHFQYHKGGNWILMDSTGRVLLDSPHEVYLVINKKRFLVTKYSRKNGYERSIVNQKGEILSEIIYHDIWRVNDHTLYAGYNATFHDASELRKSTKWVLLDENGTRINSKIYKYLIPLNEKWIKASEKKGELRVIDEKGKDVLGYEVDDIYMYREDLFKISNNKKHQFLDLAHPKYTSKEYDNLRCVNGNFFGIHNIEGWGFLNTKNFKEIYPTTAEEIKCFKAGVASVQNNGVWTLIDSTGSSTSEKKYSYIKPLEHGYTLVGNKGTFGVLNKKGEFIVPLIHPKIHFAVEHDGGYFFAVKKDGKFGIINEKNEVVHPFIYEVCHEIGPFAHFQKKRQDGYYAYFSIERRSIHDQYFIHFDDTRNESIPKENHYKGFKVVEERCLKYGTCVGVDDWDGNRVIPCEYKSIREFKNNTFRVHSNRGIGLVDTMGNILIPPVYERLQDLSSKHRLIQVGRSRGPWGLYNYDGVMIADTFYGGFERPIDSIIPFHANYNYRFVIGQGWQKNEKKVGLMTLGGKIIAEPLYDKHQYQSTEKHFILRHGTKTAIVDLEGNLIHGEFAVASSSRQAELSGQGNQKVTRKSRQKLKRKRKRPRLL